MKQQLKLLAMIASIAGYSVNAQNNPCNMQWGQLEKVFTHSMGTVSIRIQSSTCGNYGGICGVPRIAILHTFNGQSVTVDVELKGTDCDGKQHVSGFVSSNQANVEDRSGGNWHTFKSVQGVVGVTVRFKRGDDYYEIIWDKEKGINKTLKNNSILLSNGKTETEIAKEKQKEQEEKERLAKEAEEKRKKEKDDQERARLVNERKEQERVDRELAIQKQRTADSTRYEEASKAKSTEAYNNARDANNAAITTTTKASEDLLAMDLDNTRKKDKAYWKMNLGVEYFNIPAVMNYTSKTEAPYSEITETMPMAGMGELEFIFLNKPKLQLSATAFGKYGWILNGQGDYTAYGGRLRLLYGKRVQLMSEFEYSAISGKETKDYDAILDLNSGLEGTIKYSYSSLCAGIGINFWLDEDEDNNLSIGYYAEKPDFIAGNYFAYSARLQCTLFYGITFAGRYGNKYFASGKPEFYLKEVKPKDFWSITISKAFNLSAIGNLF